MSKVLPAKCIGGAVTAGAPLMPLPSAEVLSEGVGQSDGIAVVDEHNAWYLANIAPDLKTLLERVIDALTQVKAGLDKTASALTSIDTHSPLATSCGAGAGTATWTPVAASDISGITSASGQIESLKSQLNTLKGALR